MPGATFVASRPADGQGMDPDDNEYRWVLAGAAMLTQAGSPSGKRQSEDFHPLPVRREDHQGKRVRQSSCEAPGFHNIYEG